MLLTAMFGMAEFYSLRNNLDVLMNAVSGMPRIVCIVFGTDSIPVNTPLGCYATMYYYFGIIAYCFAVYTGVYIIARDERFKTSEFLYTKPFSRNSIITAKMLVAALNIIVMAVVTVVGSLVFLVPLFPEANLANDAVITTVGMLLTMLVFLAIGLFSATASKSYGRALLSAFITLILCYAVSFMIEYTKIVNLEFITPIRWFDVKSVTDNGISILYVLLVAAITAVGVWLALKCYKKRDLHV
jgi:ABC-2 type transport system permease protein